MNKKGYAVGDLLPLALTFVVVAIAIAIGASVLSNVRSSSTFVANDYGYNATTKGLAAMSTFGNWLPTLALIVIAAIIIGVLIMYMANKFG
jgi:type II secretory pathway component PulF